MTETEGLARRLRVENGASFRLSHFDPADTGGLESKKDAAGKDSVIKHVMPGVNPRGCQVYPFMHAYEEMVQNTTTPHAPWYVVPADNKRFTRLVVASAIVNALGSLSLKVPGIGAARRKELKAARAYLEVEAR